MENQLPLTNGDRNLLNLIQSEITEWNNRSMQIVQEMDNTTDPDKLEKLFDELCKLYKYITARSKTREEILNRAKLSLFGKRNA